jgi:hypothetical protein
VQWSCEFAELFFTLLLLIAVPCSAQRCVQCLALPLLRKQIICVTYVCMVSCLQQQLACPCDSFVRPACWGSS